ncbi:MAG: HAMP domain-containing protein [Bacteroidota bacterium]
MFAKIKKSIKSKLLILTALILIVISAAIIVYSTVNTKKIAKENARKLAKIEADKFIKTFKSKIEDALLTVRTLSGVYSQVNAQENPLKISRQVSNNILREQIERNKDLYGIYVSWLPDNSFDGMDNFYAGKKNETFTGRYLAYHIRKNGKVVLAEQNLPADEWESEQKSEYFGEPRRKMNECITNPYWFIVEGKNIFMVTVASPIIDNNKFYGIISADFELDFIQNFADKVDIFDKTGIISIISNNGSLIGGTGLRQYLGKNVDSIPEFSDLPSLLELVRKGAEIDTVIDDRVEILFPVHFGKTDTPWAALVQVPLEVPMQAANNMLLLQILISAILAIIGIILTYWFVNRTTKPIIELVGIARNIKEGRIDDEIRISSEDEIGELSRAFKEMSGKIRGIIDEINDLGVNLYNGKLDYRASLEGYGGAFGELVRNINEAINNIIRPLNVAAEYIDRISKGDIPPKIVEEYRGDFNEIKNNINQCIDAINLLLKDTYELVDNTSEGKITYRADGSRHQGDFRRLIEGINASLDRLVGLIDNMPVPVQIVDRSNNVLYRNKTLLE